MTTRSARAVQPHDVDLMRAALCLARRNLGQTWPNPAVGCLIVRDEPHAPRIAGRGWTGRGGRPHAETEALRAAGDAAKGATAYVSLEPCAHHGHTGPCAQALAEAGVARAVIAAQDPDPRVNGHGIAILEAAGIAVTLGVERAAAQAVNRGFFKRVTHALPFVTLKIASTLDGRIATASHQSQWITGERARAEAHALRAEHDAILIGSSTVGEDNPTLTCRLPGLSSRSPVRIIADSRLRTPLTSHLAIGAREVPTWLLTVPGADMRRRQAYIDLGIDLIEVVPGADGHIDLKLALELVAARGITRVLAEGGAELAAALVLARLVDEIIWFRAPSLIGATGLAAIAGLGLDDLDALPRFKCAAVRALGEDLVEAYSATDTPC